MSGDALDYDNATSGIGDVNLVDGGNEQDLCSLTMSCEEPLFR